MKGMIFWVLLVLCFTTMAFAQKEVDAPVWNVGDKWVFTDNGTIEVVSADQNSYVLEFSDDICEHERQGFNTILFDKSTLHRIYTLEGDERKKYTNALRTIFNFPLTPGKQWKDTFHGYKYDLDYYVFYRVLGWEKIKVQAGKFRAIKLQTTGGHEATEDYPAYHGSNLYWYSPEVKYFVKCQYDGNAYKVVGTLGWELTDFNVKK
jgi:hypothetical protein